MISVLTPSRNRTDLLAKSVQSLRVTAYDARSFEVLVIADPDDGSTAQAAIDLGCRAFQTSERWGYHNLNLYYNALADNASGDWLLLWNDDALMQTAGWDQLIKALPDKILVGDLQSQLSPDLCCFPVVRKAAVKLLGGFSPFTPHCDTWWQDIGRQTNTIAPVNAFVFHDRSDLTGNNHDRTRVEALQGYRQAEYYSSTIQSKIAEAVAHIKEAYK